MRPVHEFKANFNQAEPAAQDQPDSVADALTLHDADSSVRNLCLIWDDGRRAFLNYAYLVAGELSVQDGINVLLLSFGSYTALLKGYNLAALFNALLEHSPKIITAINPRYLAQHDPQGSVVMVTEIVVRSE